MAWGEGWPYVITGTKAGVALPFRGQAEVVMPSEEELAAAPEGICHETMIRSRMTRGVCATGGPLRHAGLGLSAYVQSTSPIRRYGDLLAHWQLKVKRHPFFVLSCRPERRLALTALLVPKASHGRCLTRGRAETSRSYVFKVPCSFDRALFPL